MRRFIRKSIGRNLEEEFLKEPFVNPLEKLFFFRNTMSRTMICAFFLTWAKQYGKVITSTSLDTTLTVISHFCSAKRSQCHFCSASVMLSHSLTNTMLFSASQQALLASFLISKLCQPASLPTSKLSQPVQQLCCAIQQPAASLSSSQQPVSHLQYYHS